MRCSPFDLKDYFLQELSTRESTEVEAHVKSCQACREELARLGAARTALLALKDEEVPQRIAFVSDKVFEPSPWRRFWLAAARHCAVPAATVAAVLIAYPMLEKKPAPAPAPQPAVDVAKLQAEFDRRLNEAVSKAVADSEARQQSKTAELLAAQEHRNELERKAVVLAMEENLEVMRKKLNVMILASNEFRARP